MFINFQQIRGQNQDKFTFHGFKYHTRSFIFRFDKLFFQDRIYVPEVVSWDLREDFTI